MLQKEPKRDLQCKHQLHNHVEPKLICEKIWQIDDDEIWIGNHAVEAAHKLQIVEHLVPRVIRRYGPTLPILYKDLLFYLSRFKKLLLSPRLKGQITIKLLPNLDLHIKVVKVLVVLQVRQSHEYNTHSLLVLLVRIAQLANVLIEILYGVLFGGLH